MHRRNVEIRIIGGLTFLVRPLKYPSRMGCVGYFSSLLNMTHMPLDWLAMAW
jgi:hypothetical protein